ncbi:MAG: hotdog fold thioesterase [Crocinitomicaceae bacterium]|nr:hotdog fold thioesterase [Crocinitomicaceae bacterium]
MQPIEIVQQMLASDAFSQWLGLELVALSPGACQLKMVVRKEMTNGFQIAHGGITFSLSDSALAFAANSYGFQSVSIDTSIAHLKPVQEGDVLIANCTEISRTNAIGKYEVQIKNQDDQVVSHFLGTVYITKKRW